MFGLKVPAAAAAGVAVLLAVGGMSAPRQAVADEGGAGSGAGSGSTGSQGSSSAGSSTAAGSMDVSPHSVAPGGVVTLHLEASCKAGQKASASAEVFVSTVTLAPADDGRGMEGSAFIKTDAVDGSYAIAVQCDGVASSASASITVTTGAGSADPSAPTLPDQPLTPVRPVPAGGGGTAQLAAGPAAQGTSTGALLATGGFAVLGLTGLVVRRRRTAARG